MKIVKLFFPIWTLQKIFFLPHTFSDGVSWIFREIIADVSWLFTSCQTGSSTEKTLNEHITLFSSTNKSLSLILFQVFDVWSNLFNTKKEINNYLQKNSWKQNLSEFFKFFREIKVYYLHYYTYRRTLHNHLHYYKNFVGQIVYSFLSVSLLLKKKSTVFSQFYG